MNDTPAGLASPRLAAEWTRLFGAGPASSPGAAGAGEAASVARLEVAGSGGWARLAELWRGVQSDLDWPAPAIAVAGRDAWQLWFFLAEPVAADRFEAVLRAAADRWLTGPAAHRWSLDLGVPPSLPPACQPDRRWSAWVSPDLAPVFGDEPWLDEAPNPDAQAELLSRVRPIPSSAWSRAVGALCGGTGGAPARAPGAVEPASISAGSSPPADDGAGPAAASRARAFLLRVMDDASLDWAHRIAAARALLKDGR